MIDALVVDNSVVMSWCFKDETNPYADAVLDKLSEATAIVPRYGHLKRIRNAAKEVSVEVFKY